MKRLNILLIFVLLSSGAMAAPLTPYYLPKKGTTGSETVDSQIYDTGAYVGIGTNAPTSKLHVNGNILVDGQNTLSMGNHMLITGLSNAVGAAPGAMFNVGDNNWLLFNNNVNMYMSDDGARSDGSYKIGWEPTKDYTLAKEQAGQNSQFLYANIYGDYTWGEHVNINTTADGSRAFIAGLHATDTKGYSTSMDDINNTATAFIVYQGGTNPNANQKIIDIRATENWQTGAAQGTFTGKVFNYSKAGVTKFKIDSDGGIYSGGAVGIGTSSPRGTLDVDGIVYASGFSSTGSGSGKFSSSGGFSFDPYNNTFTTSLFEISTTGAIGIGTSDTSAARLTVKGGGTGSNNAFKIVDSGNTSRLVVQDQGYVGIGTSNPASTLCVGSTCQFSVTASGAVGAASYVAPFLTGGSSATVGLSIKSTSGTGTTDYIKFSVGSNGATEAMRIVNSGNVGIGTTTPSQKFTVDGSIYIMGVASKVKMQSPDGTVWSCQPANTTGVWTCS